MPPTGGATGGALAPGIPPWMILRRPATESRGVFFSSSKMICASVAVVRSARVVFSTTRTSSPARTIAAMWSSVT